jgi:hypothetical protein
MLGYGMLHLWGDVVLWRFHELRQSLVLPSVFNQGDGMRTSRDYILYKSGYKYQLAEDYSIETGIAIDDPIETDYLHLSIDGTLTIWRGYAWDGPSGPAIDTNNFMRGSLTHDCCYQLIRERYLPGEFREQADRLLQKICMEDGMSRIRAWWVYLGVRLGGGPAADPRYNRRTFQSPAP